MLEFSIISDQNSLHFRHFHPLFGHKIPSILPSIFDVRCGMTLSRVWYDELAPILVYRESTIHTRVFVFNQRYQLSAVRTGYCRYSFTHLVSSKEFVYHIPVVHFARIDDTVSCLSCHVECLSGVPKRSFRTDDYFQTS